MYEQKRTTRCSSRHSARCIAGTHRSTRTAQRISTGRQRYVCVHFITPQQRAPCVSCLSLLRFGYLKNAEKAVHLGRHTHTFSNHMHQHSLAGANADASHAQYATPQHNNALEHNS